MSFLVWLARDGARLASTRRVLRASEVPLLHDAGRLCERLAELQAEERQRIEAATQQAMAEGREQGLAEGRAAANEEIAASLAAIAMQCEAERDRLRGEIAGLALQVARKMLGRFAEDELLAALADTAAEDVLPGQRPTLVVHPDLCEAVKARLSAVAGAEALEVRGDAGCRRDACRIETEHGSIDASLKAQMEKLAGVWGVEA